MARGVRDIEIQERGVCLTLSVRGTKYEINPSPADILRVSEKFGQIYEILKKEGTGTVEHKTPRDPNSDERAQIADFLLHYLSGENETFFRSLPTEMQALVVRELWRWYEALDFPAINSDPTRASSPSPTIPRAL